MASIKDMREALRRYRKASEEADRAQDLWDADPYDEAAEKEADETYERECAALGELTGMIMELIGTDARTARAMVLRDGRLDELLARAR